MRAGHRGRSSAPSWADVASRPARAGPGVRRPTSGPGFDVLAAALGPAHGARGRGDRPLRGRDRPARSRATAATCACAGSPRCARPDGARSRSGPTSRCRAASGRAPRPTSPAWPPPTRSTAAAPTCWRTPRGSRATRTTSRPRCSAASWCARARAAERFEPPPGLRVRARRPRPGGPHREGAGGAAGRGPDGRRRLQRRPREPARARARARRPRAVVARGLDDRLHQPRRAPLYPRSLELVRRARRLGALGATISGAGPTVLVWCGRSEAAGCGRAARSARRPAGRA